MPQHRGSPLQPQQQSAMAGPDKTLLKGTHEVPVTAPIFEGHLYLRTDKKRWQWRLFRFDGTSLTCLSTRKVKLPPHTPVDVPNDIVENQLNQSPSFNTSLTSPLLATPKDKSMRLVSMGAHRTSSDLHALATTGDNQMMASYYQLPKWTVDVSRISAISVLKRSQKKRSPFPAASSRSKSKCFSIRTFDNQCYILKAQKYKDLERWLFVLTKMWRFAQMIRSHLAANQSQRQQQEIALDTCHHQNGPENDNADRLFTMRNLVPPLPTPPRPPAPQRDPEPPPQTMKLPYDSNYAPPTLSAQKLQWIEEWRKSLAQLMTHDKIPPSPPPIESFPDDDGMSSSLGELTSISVRERPTKVARRPPSVRSFRSSSRRNGRSSGADAPANASSAVLCTQEMPLDDRPSSSLKKKRSSEVKNWISNNKTETQDATDICKLNFFQDARTIMEGETDADTISGDKARLVQGEATVRYHGSVRGRCVRVVNNRSLEDQEADGDANNQTMLLQETSKRGNAALFAKDNEQLHLASPLQALAKADTAHVIQQQMLENAKKRAGPHRRHASMEATENDDDDMSLADLQRSLRRLSMNDAKMVPSSGHSWNMNQAPAAASSSSIVDRSADKLLFAPLRPPPPPTPQHMMPSYPIVAPAIPPVPVLMTPSFPPTSLAYNPTPHYYYPMADDLAKSKQSYRTSTGSKRASLQQKGIDFSVSMWSAAEEQQQQRHRPQSWIAPSASTPTFKDLQSHKRRSDAPFVGMQDGSTTSSHRRSVGLSDRF